MAHEGQFKNIESAKNDLTQEQLAEKIGVSRQTINSIEKGKYIPSTLLALNFQRYLTLQ